MTRRSVGRALGLIGIVTMLGSVLDLGFNPVIGLVIGALLVVGGSLMLGMDADSDQEDN